MVVCLERGADLHSAQLMPLPLTVSRFSKIQIGFTFLVPAYPGSPGERSVKRVCVCVCGAGAGTGDMVRYGVLYSYLVGRLSVEISPDRRTPALHSTTALHRRYACVGSLLVR